MVVGGGLSWREAAGGNWRPKEAVVVIQNDVFVGGAAPRAELPIGNSLAIHTIIYGGNSYNHINVRSTT